MSQTTFTYVFSRDLSIAKTNTFSISFRSRFESPFILISFYDQSKKDSCALYGWYLWCVRSFLLWFDLHIQRELIHILNSKKKRTTYMYLIGRATCMLFMDIFLWNFLCYFLTHRAASLPVKIWFFLPNLFSEIVNTTPTNINFHSPPQKIV